MALRLNLPWCHHHECYLFFSKVKSKPETINTLFTLCLRAFFNSVRDSHWVCWYIWVLLRDTLTHHMAAAGTVLGNHTFFFFVVCVMKWFSIHICHFERYDICSWNFSHESLMCEQKDSAGVMYTVFFGMYLSAAYCPGYYIPFKKVVAVKCDFTLVATMAVMS